VNAEKLKSKLTVTYQIMKKEGMIIAILCILALSSAEAQVNKGRILLGVSTSFNYSNYGSDLMSLGFTTIKQNGNLLDPSDGDSYKITTFNFLPKFGYLIVNNLAIGLNACISTASQKLTPNDRYRMTSFGLGPFVRYYIPCNKVLPFLEINSEFGSVIVKNVNSSYTSTSHTSMSSFGAGAGMAARLGEKVTFDIMAGYNSMIEKAKEYNPNNDKTVQGTFGVKFGFVILLGSN
jgi:hypothetical protein